MPIHHTLRTQLQQVHHIHSMMEGMKLMFKEGNPAGIKSVLDAHGICGSAVRLPLVEASPKLKVEIDEFLRAFSKIKA